MTGLGAVPMLLEGSALKLFHPGQNLRRKAAWRGARIDDIDPDMAVTVSSLFWLHLAAIASLVPLTGHAFMRRQRGRAFWVFVSFATCAFLYWVIFRLGLASAFSFSGTLDLIVVGTLLAFMAASLFWRDAAALIPLVLIYCLPLALISLLTDVIGPGGHASGPTAAVMADAWFWVHILLAVGAFSLLTIAALAGGAVWLRERQLKARRHSDFVSRLPPVAAAEALQFHLLQISAILLAAGLATGMATTYVETGSLLILDHKNVLSFTGFALILLMLLAHNRFGLRGRKAVRLLLIAWLMLTLGFPGVKFVSEIMA